MDIKVPIRQVNILYHWGTLDPQNVGKNGPSMEGNCLSASLCPDTWLTLARLGAERLYSLEAKSSVFADVHELMNKDKWAHSKEALLAHAEKAGYINLEKVWEVQQYCDDELVGTLTCFDFESALIEANEMEDDIRESRKYLCTPALLGHLGLHEKHKAFGEEYGLIAALKDFCLSGVKLDGIYFANDYDPDNYIAPCFGIFPEKVSRWSFNPAHDIENDENLMSGLGQVKSFSLGDGLDLNKHGLSM